MGHGGNELVRDRHVDKHHVDVPLEGRRQGRDLKECGAHGLTRDTATSCLILPPSVGSIPNASGWDRSLKGSFWPMNFQAGRTRSTSIVEDSVTTVRPTLNDDTFVRVEENGR